MKHLTIILFVVSLITILFSTKLKAQKQNDVLAVITETTEYQTSKEAGEKLFASLRSNVPTANKKQSRPNVVRKYQISTKSELDSLYKRNWNKLELDNDGSICLELPFTFSFFNSRYKSIWINANGNLSFGQPIGHFEPEKLPVNVQMIAPFWTDLEANIQNEAAGIFILSDKNGMHILYNKMSLYKQDPLHTISFEVIVKAGIDSLNGNVAFIYHQVAPELITRLKNIEAIGKTAFVIGINGGDDTNYVQVKQFENTTYLFNQAAYRP